MGAIARRPGAIYGQIGVTSPEANSAGTPAKTPAPRGGSVVASWLLACVILGTLVDILHPMSWVVVGSAALLVVYFALEWRRLVINARVLLGASLALALVIVARLDTAVLLPAARRMILLPSFLALLSLLRAAASQSPAMLKAGRHLVNQPPSRRYVALAMGSNLFGMLLNIGGLVLLLDMTRQANTLAAAGGNPRVVEWRERRMTIAALRGFATIPLYSPLGIALNLILGIVGLSWTDVGAPAMAAAAAFMVLGWLFDRLGAPKGLGITERPPNEPGGARGVAVVVGHVAALFLLTLAGELLFNMAFQLVLMFCVPLYALGWLLAINLGRSARRPLRASLGQLYDRGVAQFSFYGNETAAFAASGFMAAALAAIVPREPLQALLTTLAAPPGVIAALLAGTVFLLALIGLNPIITVSILAGTVSAIGVPGLTPEKLALALAGGWACTVGFGPLQPSMILTAGLIGRSPREIGLTWNGPYALTAIALWVLVLLFVPF